MRDPFLKDAIDGYDQVNDRPVYHLKRLEKRLSKRKKNKFLFLRRWGIVAGILFIIGVSIFFFSSSKVTILGNKTFLETHEDNVISNYTKEQVADVPVVTQLPDSDIFSEKIVIENNKKVNATGNSTDLSVEKSQPAVQQIQQKEKKKAEETQQIAQKEVLPLEESTHSTISNDGASAVNINSEKETPETNHFVKSQPVKGDKAFTDYVIQNRKQLVTANCENRHGKVTLMFRVNEQGRPVDISIFRSLCPDADREAVRLLQNGPNWTESDSLTRLEIEF